MSAELPGIGLCNGLDWFSDRFYFTDTGAQTIYVRRLNQTRVFAKIEWGPEIRCVGIAPGFIDTPGNDTWFNSFPDPDAERKRTEKSHPVGRIGSTE